MAVNDAILDFDTSGQSMWGSGSAASINFTKALLGGSFGPLTGVTSVFGLPVSGSVSGTAALDASITGNTGTVSVDYPVDVEVDTPDSVVPGQAFIVSTNVTGLGQAALDTQFPSINASLSLDLSAQVSGGVGPFSFSPSWAASVPLGTVGSGSSVNLAFGDTSVDAAIPNAFATAGTAPATQARGSTLRPISSIGQENGNFLQFNVDSVVGLAKDLPIPTLQAILGADQQKIGLGLLGTWGYNILDASVHAGLGLAQKFTFVPQEVDVTLTPNFSPVGKTGRVGSSFSFVVPTTWTQSVSISASYSLKGSLISETDLVGSASIAVTAVQFQLGPDHS